MDEEYRSNGQFASSGNATTVRAAAQYLRAGLGAIPVPAGQKNPNRPDWQKEQWAVEDAPELWTNGQGIGILWGTPSGGLVDIDCDWPEAAIAARYIAPATRTFGRSGSPASHRLLRTTDTAPKTKRYKVPGTGDDNSVVELLSTGTQSLVPPSLHASGERRAWYDERAAAEVSAAECEGIAADTATAALIARHWPFKGARHEYVLAATGYIGRKLPRERAERIMRGAIAASNDEEADKRCGDVTDTLDNLAADRPTTGGPVLAQLAPGVVDQLQRWHGWRGERNGGQTSKPGREATPYNLTDLGNAQRFVRDHGDSVRYCYPWGKWLVWDGKRWAVDDSGKAERLAKDTVRGIYAEAHAEENEKARKALAEHARKSESKTRITDALYLARSEPGVPVAPNKLDADPWLFNTTSGTVDLRTGELREHRREDLITKLASVEYAPDAEAPVWMAALERWLPSEALRSFAQRVAGYVITGDVSEQVLPFLCGPGANGKTTFMNTLLAVAGDYGQQAAPDLLLAKRGGHPTELADLFGARLVASVEVEDGRRLAESLVKQLTGGDRIKARRMREDFWEFDPTHKAVLVANHKPVVRGTDHAIWRRIKLVPFEAVIPKAERDPRLPEKLKAELPGVLAWAVRGCLDWQREGLGEPEEVAEATARYRDESDLITGFIEDCCTVGPGVWCKFKALWDAYNEWRKDANEQHGLTRQKFADRLTERGFEGDRGTGNVAIRHGVALRFGGDDDPAKVNSPNPGSNESNSKTPPKQDAGGDSGAEGDSIVNSETPAKPGIVNTRYPEVTINEIVSPRRRYTGNPLTGVNELTVAAEEAPEEKPGGGWFEGTEKAAPGTPEAMLADPPTWLVDQLEWCRATGGPLGPPAVAISDVVYDTTSRWQEIVPILEAYMREGHEDL